MQHLSIQKPTPWATLPARSRPARTQLLKRNTLQCRAFDEVVSQLASHPSIVHETSQLVTQLAANPVAELASPLDWPAFIFGKILTTIDDVLETFGVPQSYGYAIVILTIIVKTVAFPLLRIQMESSARMGKIAPAIKKLQTRYRDNPELLQNKMSQLYQKANANPLSGCLPLIVTIPVFIGLYRSVTNAAQEGLLKEGWLWIPSLGGPTTLNGGTSWLLPLVNGEPPVGWDTALQYLLMPFLLVVSQFAAIKIQQSMQDPSATQANPALTAVITYVAPLSIGFFSLSVPAGLTVYWFANNIITTAQQIYLKRTMDLPEIDLGDDFLDAQEPTPKLTDYDKAARDQKVRREKEAGQQRSQRGRSSKFQQLKASEGSNTPKRGAKFASRKIAETKADAPAASSSASPPAATSSDLPSPPPVPKSETVKSGSNNSPSS